LALFGAAAHPVVQKLRNLEPNTMTPIQALELIARLADEAREGGTA
jgi:type I site-specific restriction endonuclease